jgi:hypothetical protein
VVAIVAAAGLGWRARAEGAVSCDGGAEAFAGVWDDGVRDAVARAFASSHVPYADTATVRVAAILDDYRAAWIGMHGDACRATRERGEQSEHVLDLRMACLDRRRDEVAALTKLLAGAPAPDAVAHAAEAAASLPALDGCADTAALLQPGAESSDPRVRALRSRLADAAALRSLGRYRDALEPVRAIGAGARSLGDHRLLADTLRLQGQLETRLGELAHAHDTLAAALAQARLAGDLDRFGAISIDVATALGEAGISQAREGLGALRVADGALADTTDRKLPLALALERANLWLELAHAKDALPILERATAEAERTLPPGDPLRLRAREALADGLSLSGRGGEAAVQYRAVIAAETPVLGALHPATIATRIALCRALHRGGLGTARPCYEAVLGDADRVLGASDRHVVGARSDFGDGLLQLGRFDDARRVLRVGFAAVPAADWTAHWFIAMDLARELGETEVALGDFTAARDHCTRALAAADEQHLPFMADACIAEADVGVGDSAAAVALLAPLEKDAADADPLAAASWRAAYARAVWASMHDGKRARALGEQARAQLVASHQAEWRIARLDAWLATLPSAR